MACKLSERQVVQCMANKQAEDRHQQLPHLCTLVCGNAESDGLELDSRGARVLHVSNSARGNSCLRHIAGLMRLLG